MVLWTKCLQIGVFGTQLAVEKKMCRRRLHAMGASRYCRECRYLRQMAHWYALKLAEHWTRPKRKR